MVKYVKLVQLMISCAAIMAWTLFGGGILHEIEGGDEKSRVSQYCGGKNELKDIYSGNVSIVFFLESAITSSGLCRAPVCPEEEGDVNSLSDKELNWSFSGACFFCFTIITTIGYGNYVPATVRGKSFTLFFGTVGFVLYAFAMNNFKHAIDDILWKKNTWGAIRKAIFNFFLVFLWLLTMSVVYAEYEGWPFRDALYFSYITATSIGFGDFAPTKTRDWPINYVLIGVSLILMTNFVASFCAIFHSSKVDSDSVNLDHKRSNKKHGLLYLMYDEYVHNFKIQLLCLWALTLAYMFIGGALFKQIEVYGIKRGNYGEVGEDAMSALNGEREQFEDYLKDEIATVSDASSDADVKLVTEKWGVMHDLMNSAGTCPPPTGKEEQWALTNGAIFCLTVLTTIGYGNVVPVTDAGKVFCVLYSLIGFVIYAKVQTTTVKWINKGITRRTDEMGSCYRTFFSEEFEYFRLGVTTGGLVLLISAGSFTATENWTFFEGIWFTFISTTTIGLGDFTPVFHGWNFVLEFLMILFGLSAIGLVVHIIFLYGEHWASMCLGKHSEAEQVKASTKAVKKIQKQRKTLKTIV